MDDQRNVFKEAEQVESAGDAPTGTGPGTGNNTGDLEGDDITPSIDYYIPLLVLTALGMIIYTKKKKSKTI